MKRVLAILLCLPFTVFLLLNGFLIFTSYESQVQTLVDLFAQPSLESYLRTVAYPPKHYQAALVILPIFTLLIGVLTFYAIQKNRAWNLLTHLRKRARWSVKSVWNTLKSQPTSHLIFLSAILVFYFIRSFYNALYYPIQHDEYWTFNYFSNGNFIKVFAPGNNHFFNSLGNYLCHYLPIPEPLIFRLPVIIGGFFTLLIFYLFLVKTISSKISIIGTSLLCFSPPFLFYSMYGRGYIFLLFFTIICFWCWIRFTQTQKRYYKIIFTLAAFAGVLSVMTFAYVLLTFGIMSFVQIMYKKWTWKNLLLFYAPLLLLLVCWSIPGWLLGQWQTTLAYKPEMHHEGMEIMTSFLFRNAYFFLGFKKLGLVFWLLLIICFLGLKDTNDSWKYLHLFSILSFCIVFIMSLLQGFEITERFAFHLILLPIAALTFVFTEKFKPFWAYLSLGVFCLIFSFGAYTHKYLNWSVNADYAAKEMNSKMIAANITEVYLDDNYYKPAIIYFYSKNNAAIRVYSSAPQSIDYVPFDAHKKYEAIICDTDNAPFYSQKGYKVAYQNKAATLFVP